jgi:hypothetical protein
LRLPDRRGEYEIVVANPRRCAAGVTAVLLDGQPAVVIDGAARVPVTGDGRPHRVEVTLGARA